MCPENHEQEKLNVLSKATLMIAGSTNSIINRIPSGIRRAILVTTNACFTAACISIPFLYVAANHGKSFLDASRI